MKATIFKPLLFLGCLLVAHCSGYGKEWKRLVKLCPQLACPDGYVQVACNADVDTTANFCVAKYEMKCAADATGAACTGAAVSQAANKPWVNISQTAAISQCSSLGANYHLITNPESMTIARNIETTASNWSTGTVGSGNLSRGWSASVADDGYANTAVAPSTGASCLYNTAADSCGLTGTHLYKRTHTISNGEVIWDFSGNVSEWNDWNVVTDKASPQSAYIDINTVAVPTATMTAATFQSTNNTLTAITNAIGKYFPGLDGAGGAALRGGNESDGSNAGVFALILLFVPSSPDPTIGFRCSRSE